jgi:hypothetical protein
MSANSAGAKAKPSHRFFGMFHIVFPFSRFVGNGFVWLSISPFKQAAIVHCDAVARGNCFQVVAWWRF